MRLRKTISYKTLASLLVMVAYMVTGAAYAQQSKTITTVTYFLTDAQGNVLATMDAQGNITARYTYRPYGTQQSGPTNAGPGYTGHVNDPDTGLVYMQQRYYDPEIKRFPSPDPVGPTPGNIYSFNRYAYANNNPVRYTDPDGRDSVGEMINSAAQGCGAVSCAGYALLHAAWVMTGAEPVSQVADKGWSNVSTSDKIGAVTAVASVIPVGRIAGKVVEGAEKATTVIGRVDKVTGEVSGIKSGENSLLKHLPDQGSPKANWKQNAGVLRREMSKEKPIRDAAPDDNSGQFLNAERNLLKDRGWTFDPKTNHWNPPEK